MLGFGIRPNTIRHPPSPLCPSHPFLHFPLTTPLHLKRIPPTPTPPIPPPQNRPQRRRQPLPIIPRHPIFATLPPINPHALHSPPSQLLFLHARRIVALHVDQMAYITAPDMRTRFAESALALLAPAGNGGDEILRRKVPGFTVETAIEDEDFEAEGWGVC